MGIGTRFQIYLPSIECISLEHVEATTLLPRGRGELILVVDDESAVRQVTKQTLESFGYRVALASDGAEALAIYAQRQAEVAVVLTDINMPIMDGLAIIRVILKMNPAAQIIAASGLDINGETARFGDVGGKYFLSKPYSADILLQLLRKILGEDSQDSISSSSVL